MKNVFQVFERKFTKLKSSRLVIVSQDPGSVPVRSFPHSIRNEFKVFEEKFRWLKGTFINKDKILWEWFSSFRKKVYQIQENQTGHRLPRSGKCTSEIVSPLNQEWNQSFRRKVYQIQLRQIGHGHPRFGQWAAERVLSLNGIFINNDKIQRRMIFKFSKKSLDDSREPS